MERSRTGPQLTIFQPGLVLLCSLTGAALVGLYLCRDEHVRATILDPGGTFWYFVPLMVPCLAFMIERVQHVRQANFFQHGVDFLVFGLAVVLSHTWLPLFTIGLFGSMRVPGSGRPSI